MGRNKEPSKQDTAREWLESNRERIQGYVIEIGYDWSLHKEEPNWLVSTLVPTEQTYVEFDPVGSLFNQMVEYQVPVPAHVILCDILEYVLNPLRLVAEARTYLNHEGTLLVTISPSDKSLIHITPTALEMMFQQAGLHTYDISVNPKTKQILAWAKPSDDRMSRVEVIPEEDYDEEEESAIW